LTNAGVTHTIDFIHGGGKSNELSSAQWLGRWAVKFLALFFCPLVGTD